MSSEEVKTGEIQKEFWNPLEDLYSGWEKAGRQHRRFTVQELGLAR
ncbi:hypothetical protein [Flavobacterium hungaricum]|nr:hypothetical protein [Flavobacterium hungaricum]